MPDESNPNPVLVAAAVVVRDGDVLAARRPPGSHLEGRWEFPGGKIEPGESPEECLVRELREETGVTVKVGRILEAVFHRYERKSVLLLFYSCSLVEGEPRPIECAEVRWVPRERLPELDWAPADVPFVARIAASEIA